MTEGAGPEDESEEREGEERGADRVGAQGAGRVLQGGEAGA